MVWIPDRPLLVNHYCFIQSTCLSAACSSPDNSWLLLENWILDLLIPMIHLYLANAPIISLRVTCHFPLNQLSCLYLQLRAQLLTLPKSCNCLKHWTVWTLNYLNTELPETLNCLNTELLEALNYLNTELLRTLNCLKLYAATWLLLNIYRDLPGLNFPPII